MHEITADTIGPRHSLQSGTSGTFGESKLCKFRSLVVKSHVDGAKRLGGIPPDQICLGVALDITWNIEFFNVPEVIIVQTDVQRSKSILQVGSSRDAHNW